MAKKVKNMQDEKTEETINILLMNLDEYTARTNYLALNIDSIREENNELSRDNKTYAHQLDMYNKKISDLMGRLNKAKANRQKILNRLQEVAAEKKALRRR